CGKRTTRVGATSAPTPLGVRRPGRRVTWSPPGARANSHRNPARLAAGRSCASRRPRAIHAGGDFRAGPAIGHRAAPRRYTSEMTSATAKLSDQSAQLAAASAAYAAVEHKLADVEHQHASALEAAAGHLAELQGQYERQLVQATTVRESIEQELRDTE